MFNCNANGAGGDAAQPLVPSNSLKPLASALLSARNAIVIAKRKGGGTSTSNVSMGDRSWQKIRSNRSVHRVLVLKASTAADVWSVGEGRVYDSGCLYLWNVTNTGSFV